MSAEGGVSMNLRHAVRAKAIAQHDTAIKIHI